MRVLTALFLCIAAPLGAQTRCDVHYRSQEKTDTTHRADALASMSASQMLNNDTMLAVMSEPRKVMDKAVSGR
jgi:hypothetical protein